MFLFKPKEYISCEELEYGIHFDYSGLFHCATYFHSEANNIPVAPITGNLNENFKKLIAQKKYDKSLHKAGKIIPRCKGCFQLEKKVWKKSCKISRIAISANKKCNCDCIYCTTHRNKKILNQLPDIPIYDFLIKMLKENLIENKCEIQFGGGEPTLHYEFEKIMNLFISKPEFKMRIHTSGVKYSESIAKAITLTKCHVITSLDSGNPELYRKIKNTDGFSSVIQTISEYCEAQKYSKEPTQVALKYIIIPEINDTEDFILEFLTVAKQIGCNAVRCDVENNWYKRYRNDINKLRRILYLMKFFDTKAKEMDLWQFFNDVPISLISVYKDEYDKIQI